MRKVVISYWINDFLGLCSYTVIMLQKLFKLYIFYTGFVYILLKFFFLTKAVPQIKPRGPIQAYLLKSCQYKFMLSGCHYTLPHIILLILCLKLTLSYYSQGKILRHDFQILLLSHSVLENNRFRKIDAALCFGKVYWNPLKFKAFMKLWKVLVT